jgi:hypothetical protein
MKHQHKPASEGILSLSSRSQAWPEEVDEAALHGLVGEVVRTIEPHSEADPMALLVQFLVVFGNVIGQAPFFQAEADLHHGNLFAVLVGDTAKGRKGASLGWIRQLFRAFQEEWDSNCVVSGLSSGEGLIWQVRDPLIQTKPVKEKGRVVDYEDVEVDPGVSDKRLLVIESEFASTLRVLRREGNTLSPILRQAWDQGNLQSMTKNSPAVAADAHVSIIGHITQGELRKYLTAVEAGSGFGNRFLWTCVRRSKFLPDGGSLQGKDLVSLCKRLDRAVAFARAVDRLRRTELAGQLWHEVYPGLSAAAPGLVGAVTTRAEAQVMRMAMLYALLDGRAEIDTIHLLAAMAVWKYCFDSAFYIFGETIGDQIADDILMALAHSPKGLTRTELRDLFSRHKTAVEIVKGLQLLEEAGLAYQQIEKTGGWPVERWLYRKN